MSAEEIEGFGTLDGETIELGSISLSGTAAVGRLFHGGERVVLVIEGIVAEAVTVKRDDGRLIRVHKLKVSSAAEPTDTLAAEAETFLKSITDQLEGRTPLPFPGEGPEGDGWTYDQPDPQPPEDDDESETEEADE